MKGYLVKCSFYINLEINYLLFSQHSVSPWFSFIVEPSLNSRKKPHLVIECDPSICAVEFGLLAFVEDFCTSGTLICSFFVVSLSDFGIRVMVWKRFISILPLQFFGRAWEESVLIPPEMFGRILQWSRLVLDFLCWEFLITNLILLQVTCLFRLFLLDSFLVDYMFLKFIYFF